MLRIVAAVLLLPLTLSGCLAVAAVSYADHQADPFVQVVRAEQQFALMAQSQGQWTAFGATAAPEATMFVPQPVDAQTWLAGRADPPRAVAWQPHAVYISCDGRTAATTGAAQWPGGSHGRFTTIWQKQADGSWKWVADQGGDVAQAIPAPATIVQRSARCARSANLSNPAPLIRDATDSVGSGRSADGSLIWQYVVRPNGALRFTVDLESRGSYERVIDDGAGGA